MNYIDTHAHLDGAEFADDLDEVVARAREAGVSKILIPAIDLSSVNNIIAVCDRYKNYAFPMIGLHPEEVKKDYDDVLHEMRTVLDSSYNNGHTPFIAIGETGLDYYWSREFENEQLAAFEKQVEWSVETRLPLMVHCRKAQNEMVRLLRKYEKQLLGGVFHCFTGNEKEAAELLQFSGFVLGIGGVLTFKKSNLPEMLPANVPLDRIVLETDSPYMAPVPVRGKRNESAYVYHVLKKLAECYGVSERHVADVTNENVRRVFGIQP